MPERKAWVCLHKEHGDSARRIFTSPGDREPPKCPEHPAHKMVRQPNQPYMASRKKREARKN